MVSRRIISTTRIPGDADAIKAIAFLLILATPAVQAAEDVKSPDLATLHVQELKLLERLFRENEVVQVGTELKKDDPNYARAQEFCKAQVQALKANDPSLTIPKTFITFRGQNAAQKMEDFVIDPSIPDGTYGQRCWRSHPIVLNGKTIEYDKEFEFYKYLGSEQFGTVIFSRILEKKEGASGSTGFYAYSPVRKKCVGSRGGGGRDLHMARRRRFLHFD